MPLTLEEITHREEALHQEIAERERLLFAYQLIRADRVTPSGLAPVLALPPAAAGQPPAAPVNQPAPVAPKINPALHALRSGYGGNGKAVWWAIQQMTEDYSLRDIAALLKREGWAIRSAEISVVLTRLKTRREIEEIQAGRGRRATVYRKPASVPAPEAETMDLTAVTESTTELAAAE